VVTRTMGSGERPIRHSRSLLSGNLVRVVLALRLVAALGGPRLKHFEDDGVAVTRTMGSGERPIRHSRSVFSGNLVRLVLVVLVAAL